MIKVRRYEYKGNSMLYVISSGEPIEVSNIDELRKFMKDEYKDVGWLDRIINWTFSGDHKKIYCKVR